MTNISYLCFDTADPAIKRRVAMLHGGGAQVALGGFRRTETAPLKIGGVDVVDLGQTYPGRFVQRTASVARAAVRVNRWAPGFLKDADVIIARNLEMLALAVLARRRNAPKASLVYECLDIHRLMLPGSRAAPVLVALERRLMRSCSALVVSSPAFIERYFKLAHRALPETILLENKAMLPAGGDALIDAGRSAGDRLPAGPPWRIGWFGNIRCRRSFVILRDLMARKPGLLEVVIAGTPAVNEMGDFRAEVAATPGMSFIGRYAYPDDLPKLYSGVHFSWAIDYFEAGANSSWLLPNRLYESSLFGAVPIAIAEVEVGRWLKARNLGLRLSEPLESALERGLEKLSATNYSLLRHGVLTRPLDEFRIGAEEPRRLVEHLGALRRSSLASLR